jgi:ABC-type nickel/cobalt efflux system permease component RcnA
MVIASLTGFLAGIVHVFSGPDHIAAVAPFTLERQTKNWLTGFYWGLGHSTGVWVIGILVFLLREIIPVDLISTWSERFVGIMLIAIGLWGMRRALRHRLHFHEHTHDGKEHAHFHAHQTGKHHHNRGAHQHAHIPTGIGLIHGLAGSSHLLGVLPALMLPTRGASIAYIVGFGIGSIFAMSGFSWMLGRFVRRLGEKSVLVYKWMAMGFAVMAIGVGIVWIWFAVP